MGMAAVALASTSNIDESLLSVEATQAMSSGLWRVSYIYSSPDSQAADDMLRAAQAMSQDRSALSGALQSAASDMGVSLDPASLMVSEPTAQTLGKNGCLAAHQYVEYAVAGGITTSLLDGRWRLHPFLPHPRGLKGCQFLISWEFRAILGMDLCSVGQFASIRSLCPNECNCVTGMEECPTVSPL